MLIITNLRLELSLSVWGQDLLSAAAAGAGKFTLAGASTHHWCIVPHTANKMVTWVSLIHSLLDSCILLFYWLVVVCVGVSSGYSTGSVIDCLATAGYKVVCVSSTTVLYRATSASTQAIVPSHVRSTSLLALLTSTGAVPVIKVMKIGVAVGSGNLTRTLAGLVLHNLGDVHSLYWVSLLSIVHIFGHLNFFHSCLRWFAHQVGVSAAAPALF